MSPRRYERIVNALSSVDLPHLQPVNALLPVSARVSLPRTIWRTVMIPGSLQRAVEVTKYDLAQVIETMRCVEGIVRRVDVILCAVWAVMQNSMILLHYVVLTK